MGFETMENPFKSVLIIILFSNFVYNFKIDLSFNRNELITEKIGNNFEEFLEFTESPDSMQPSRKQRISLCKSSFDDFDYQSLTEDEKDSMYSESNPCRVECVIHRLTTHIFTIFFTDGQLKCGLEMVCVADSSQKYGLCKRMDSVTTINATLPTTPSTTETPRITTPSTTETPRITTPSTTETPRITTPSTTETPRITTPSTTETPRITNPPKTETPRITTPSTTETPRISTPSTTETPRITNPPKTETPRISTPSTTETPRISTPSTTETPRITTPSTTETPRISTPSTTETPRITKTVKTECKAIGFYRDRTDPSCRRFYRCISFGSGYKRIDVECPNGTVFDEPIHVCQNPDELIQLCPQIQ